MWKSFTPAVPGHECGQDEAHQQDSGFVVPTLRDDTPGQWREDSETYLIFYSHTVGLSLSFYIVSTMWQETEQEGVGWEIF